MALCSGLRGVQIASTQGIDVIQMFPDSVFIADALIRFIPLKVIVEHERDDLLELLHEPIGKHVIDDRVKSFIQLREIVKVMINPIQQIKVVTLKLIKAGPNVV